ncbi:hypothetical protein [Bacillus ndiopicus]|uniref:hypothetical protein n=1 Tax=Bacillus ndiopicus TaxID=1347368 RepID=UPI0005AADACC|nr:hypothetical protein [Bacillus ndiopicus]
MKIFLLFIAWLIVFRQFYKFIYADKLKRSWTKYILFSMIASIIMPFVQLYAREQLGTLQENLINASAIATALLIFLIGGANLKMKIDEWSK